MIKVNGTYPFDFFRNVRTNLVITKEQAKEFLIVRHPEWKAELDGLSDDRYLFLNKGYIIIAGEDKFWPDNKNWEAGTTAIYAHDGKYSIIEWR